ncbi:protein FAR1-RELATED SEQUENCE 5-like [Chenopodium quinoa]|uniref:protein FAR1-RELATED SEQUENCE 5-like n=1 Tax=Chenopodium quinoa TaxID=63459 RepID=UPI000B795D13|nr:protein FAR1-RELATED SEQUENCE 5-like [Chenopodium quinoa]
MTEEKRQVIENLQKSGLSAMDSYRAMCNEAKGEENLGHTKKDHLNYLTRFRLNKEGKLRALFWRDSMMREDYSIYGDVVVFDTTYRTNRYNLICAPTVGINNHWKNCMFGCAFIGDEKIESFVFPEVRHSLCIWHLEQNAITRFGSMKRDKDFKRTFSYCLKRCVTEVEFETVWSSLI